MENKEYVEYGQVTLQIKLQRYKLKVSIIHTSRAHSPMIHY